MKVKNMALCGLFTAVLAVCAWISLPVGDISVTLQTFGIFLTLGLLGGKRGTLAILVYLLLGAVGAPVFSGFRGGFGTLLGTTGGYIFGFFFSGLVYWLITYWKNTPTTRLIATGLGLLVCYAAGSYWYMTGYLQAGSVTLSAVFLKCVAPFLIPDILKLALAWFLTGRLKRFVY